MFSTDLIVSSSVWYSCLYIHICMRLFKSLLGDISLFMESQHSWFFTLFPDTKTTVFLMEVEDDYYSVLSLLVFRQEIKVCKVICIKQDFRKEFLSLCTFWNCQNTNSLSIISKSGELIDPTQSSQSGCSIMLWYIKSI